MKKQFTLLVAAMLCACCLGLAACGGSGGSASASSSAPDSASSSASTASSEASASASASAEAKTEFQVFADEYCGVCDEVIAVAEKAKEAGSFDAVEAEWNAAKGKLDALTETQMEWVNKYSNGELSDIDKEYYDKVLLPKAMKAASAAASMLELIQL